MGAQAKISEWDWKPSHKGETQSTITAENFAFGHWFVCSISFLYTSTKKSNEKKKNLKKD